MKRCWWLLVAVFAAGAAGADEVSAPREEIDTARLAAMEASAAASDEALFPHLAILQPNIGFWPKVFSEYSEFQSVVHTADYPDRIFTVLDFREPAAVMVEVRA